MDENNNNNNNNEQNINVGAAFKDVADKAKTAFKETDFKAEAVNTKNFFIDFVKKPLNTVRAMANSKNGKLILAIFLIGALCLFNVLGTVIYYGVNEYLDVEDIEAKTVVLDIISPIIFLVVFAGSTYLFSGKEKKSVPTVVTTVAVAMTPLVLKSLLYIIYIVINQAISIYFIYNMFASTLSFMSIVLMMYSMKDLISKTDDRDKNFRKILLIAFVAYAILAVLSKLEIYTSF